MLKISRGNGKSRHGIGATKTVPVATKWTWKPEQICLYPYKYDPVSDKCVLPYARAAVRGTFRQPFVR